MPSKYSWSSGSSRRVSSSTSGRWFGRSPYTLFVDVKTNVASGLCRLVASSRLSVPFALTVKSVCGSDAAQSCEGCAAVWMTSSSSPAMPAEHPVDAVGVADVQVDRAEGVVRLEQPSRLGRRRRLGPEEAGPHVVLDPDDVVARLDEVPDGLRADQPARARDDRDRHAPPVVSVERGAKLGLMRCRPGRDVLEDGARAVDADASRCGRRGRSSRRRRLARRPAGRSGRPRSRRSYP